MKWIAIVAVVIGACEAEKPVDRTAALGGEVAARAGQEVVSIALVARVAAAQNVSPRDAARRLVDDAVAADAARSRGLDKAPPTAWLLEAARARFTADRLLADARASGPPTDDEVKQVSKAHWREVDRPPSARTAHALARAKAGNPKADPRAREVAEAIKAATAGATSADDFLARAKAVARPEAIEVVAEPLPPMTAAGDVTEGGGGMDAQFARAANELAKPGDISPVVESGFGWHVIYLVERLPEQRMAFEDRRIAFASEVYATRARRVVESLAADWQKRVKITILPGAESLMRTVVIESGKPAAP